MSTKKIIVFTATGAQGSSVALEGIKAGWEVWGLTRDTNSRSSQALSDKGVKMVVGNVDNIESYKGYLRGMDGAYINTDFFSVLSSTEGQGLNLDQVSHKEMQQAKAVVDACREQGVKHIVYSALDGFEEKEKQAPHFQSKDNVAKYIRKVYGNDSDHSYTFLYTSYYWVNLLKSEHLEPNPGASKGGGWILNIPIPDEQPFAGFAVEQTGIWVMNILNDPETYNGKSVPACSEYITLAQMAKQLSSLCSEKVSTTEMTKEKFHTEGFKQELGELMWRNWRMHVDGEFLRDAEESKKTCPQQLTFAQWLEQSQDIQEFLSKKGN